MSNSRLLTSFPDDRRSAVVAIRSFDHLGFSFTLTAIFMANEEKNALFWSKIVCTQYLIRHPFWKSFAIPMIIGQISAETKIDYTGSKYLSIVYLLIGAHFLSGIAISDRRFRHALGFLPHLLALCYTAYLFYSNILNQLIPWIKIRIITHALGTLTVFSFISSLHTSSSSFRSILRRLSTYFNVFYFVLNGYVLWWSNDETKLFDGSLWTSLLRLHAVACFLVSGGFSLDLFLVLSSRVALYLIGWNLFFDILIFHHRTQSETNLWIVIDYLMDDWAMLCGYFYLYQFHRQQKKRR